MGRRSRSLRGKADPSGVVHASPKGFGFVHTAEGEFFVPAEHMGGAWDGDTVSVRPIHAEGEGRPRGRLPRARVTAVLLRAHATLVGRYSVADPFGVVVPTDPRLCHDVFTMRKDAPHVADGDVVSVRVTQWPDAHARQATTGVVESVVGHEGDPSVDVTALLDRLGVSERFPDAALRQAKAASTAPDPLAGVRKDLTERFVVTIDPDDARDFDDAISLEEAGERDGRPLLRLGVHIADVSSYTPWGSALDAEARRRGTSVYLPDRVVPMLPEGLSNGACSLVPGVPKRTLTVDMLVDGEGRLVRSRCFASTVVSKARLSYDQAMCFLRAADRGQGPRAALAKARSCRPAKGALPLDDAVAARLYRMLPALSHIARARFRMRQEAGGLDFDTVEAKVRMDEQGRPASYELRERTPATSCVEEAMVLANECVAREMSASGLSCVYRVHGAPRRSSLARLLPVVEEMGLGRDVDADAFCAGDPFELQRLLSASRGTAGKELVSSLLLRAMRRASYSVACTGHYGLALQEYCHFTSPIRRYPDLEVQRMLKARLYGGDKTTRAQEKAMQEVAESSSKAERVADEAERDGTALMLVRLMDGKAGSVFPGVVSGVTPHGLYVRLPSTVEGMVRTGDLGDERFDFDERLQTLRGERTRKRFRLGQRVRVRVVAAPAHATQLVLRLA